MTGIGNWIGRGRPGVLCGLQLLADLGLLLVEVLQLKGGCEELDRCDCDPTPSPLLRLWCNRDGFGGRVYGGNSALTPRGKELAPGGGVGGGNTVSRREKGGQRRLPCVGKGGREGEGRKGGRGEEGRG